MGSFGLNMPSSLLNYIQNQPRQPMDERPPIIIAPDDAPTTRPRRVADQLDASNLAGPVPTGLAGDNQLVQTFNRGVDDSGQPQMDSSPSRVDIQSPTQAAPNMTVPPVPLYTRNKNSAGQVRPIVDTYQQGVDANGNHIGRGARFVDSFLANGGIGNPVGALFGGLLGLAAPSLGNRAAYNLDNSRFNRGLQQDLSNERADPGYQKQLDVWQQQAELPNTLNKYEQEQKINYGLRGDYLKQQGQQRLNEIAARGQNMVTAAQTRQSLKNTGDLDGLRALYTGMVDPDTGKPFTAEEADQQARADILDQKTAKTEKLWSQQAQADATTDLRKAQKDTAVATTDLRKSQTKAMDSLADLRDKQGNMVQDKIDNPDKYFKGPGGRDLTPNARYNAEIGTYDDAIKHIDRQVSQLEAGKRSGYPDPQYEAKTRQLAQDRKDLVTKKEARKQELLQQIPQGRGGQQSGKVVSPDELKKYADDNFGGDLGKAKEAYLHHARQRGITITFQ